MRQVNVQTEIKIEIEVTEKSPFFIRPYHVREEDKVVIDKEIKRLLYGHPEGRFFWLTTAQ